MRNRTKRRMFLFDSKRGSNAKPSVGPPTRSIWFRRGTRKWRLASAYAKFSGELGVCSATSAPGASHLISGLYDARLDHTPVLAVVSQ